MFAISNTSPLNYLIRLGHSNLLPDIYERILVTKAVVAELSHHGSPLEVRRWVANAPDWLERANIDRLDRTLSFALGPGEREAISLAAIVPDSLLLIDDRDGRLAAAERNIEIAGTMAVISEAATRSLLDFRESTTRLKALGFRISPDHESEIIRHHEARLRRTQLP